MKVLSIIIVFFVISEISGLEKCYKKSHSRTELVISKPSSERVRTEDLPDAYDWRSVNGTNYLTTSRTYMNPKYCGACWAFAATTSFADRLMIARKHVFPKITPAPQVLLNCGKDAGTCEDGDFMKAYEFMTKTGIPDEGCQVYDGVPKTCNDYTTCHDCYHEKCWTQKTYILYKGKEFGTVKGESNMMKEIYERGPIACGIADSTQLQAYEKGILKGAPTSALNLAVSIVGWGKESGENYWVVRNNWGTFWGEEGFFRIERGKNSFGIESDCGYIVADPTQHRKNVTETKIEAPKPNFSEDTCTITHDENLQHITSPLPHTYINPNDLPKDFDWRNVDGVNYVTWDKNQHIPQYCGSCWAQGPTSAISDRFQILLRRKFPSIDISPQSIVNCGNCGSCHGGQPICVFAWMNKHGLPDHTCQEYTASDEKCEPLGNCKVCTKEGGCKKVEKFKNYYVGEYGSVNGAERMKAEIYARGPIGCNLYSTPKFHNYTGGVYEEVIPWRINHAISIAGWGYDKESGKNYWIGRNSWGTYWGEQGWFRLAMGAGSLGVETQCSWGVPELRSEDDEE